MDPRRLVLVMAGGVVGASGRWALAEVFDGGLGSGGFPWATFLANLAGTALLAVVSIRVSTPDLRAALAVGVCGGLTTMSTFSVEVVELARTDDLPTALAYGGLSLLGGLALFVAVRRWLIADLVEAGAS